MINIFPKNFSFKGKISSRIKVCYLLSVTLLLAIFVNSSLLFAQEKKIQIHTNPISASRMPFPGQLMSLNVEVANTRDFRLPMKMLAVRDGKFYEIVAHSGLLGSNERPQYKFEIPAPLAELNYQFILIQPDGTAASTERFSVRRSCIPNVEPSLGEVPENVDGIERFNQLITENKKLEKEIANLEQASSEIDVLKELISK